MKRAGYLAFAVGVALLALLVLRANWAVLLHALTSFGVVGLLVLIILHLPVIAAAGLAWWCFGRGLPGAALSAFVRARLVRDSATVALPFSQLGGFAAGIRVLAVSGVPAVWCGLSMFADLVGEFASLFPYVGIGLAALALLAPWSGLLTPLAIGASVFAGLMVLAWIERRRIAKALHAPVRAVVYRFTGAEPELSPDIRGIFDRLDLSHRAIAANIALHFGRWAIGAVETWVAFRLMGVPVSLGNALIIDCITAALRIFAFMVPAAVGVQEGLYVLVCGIVGLPPAIALAFSFVWRARDLLIGFLGLGVWHAAEITAQAKRNAVADASRLQGI
jgi:putative membrane protein